MTVRQTLLPIKTHAVGSSGFRIKYRLLGLAFKVFMISDIFRGNREILLRVQVQEAEEFCNLNVFTLNMLLNLSKLQIRACLPHLAFAYTLVTALYPPFNAFWVLKNTLDIVLNPLVVLARLLRL